MTTELPDLVGVTEICEHLGVTRRTVETWRYRAVRGFPAPALKLHCGLIWRWADIERWAARERHYVERAERRRRALPDPLTPQERRQRRWMRSAGLDPDAPLPDMGPFHAKTAEQALATDLLRALNANPPRP